MIDLALLRKEPKRVKDLILKKDPNFDVDMLIKLDEETRALKTEVESLRKDRNNISSQASSGITDDIRQQSIEISKKLKQKDEKLNTIEAELKKTWQSCPNIPMEDIPTGGKDKNIVVATFGEKPKFDFSPSNHMQIGEKLDWLDFNSAASMTGSQFVTYKGDAVKLMYALYNLMFKINTKHGFTPIMTPEIVTEQALINSGNLPKFADDVYKIPEDNLYLIPTAEVTLTNLYANKILDIDKLPIRHCCHSSCFRREAGGYGMQERGLIRIHQFEKIELYTICKSENSQDEQKLMLQCAEEILQTLGLHYRVSMLASQDCSFSSAKTYDVEVWLPGQDKYYEVSSISNCTDFQARRAAIRYKSSQNTSVPTTFVNTLNASALALPRLIVALIENYQTKDGDVQFPISIQAMLDKLW